MSVPSWWPALLLATAAFRTWRLLAKDTILDRLRSLMTNLPVDWEEGDPVPANFRAGFADFILCSWCAGFWVSIAWWAAWQEWPHGSLVVAAPFTISAIVGLVAQLDEGEE